MGAHNRFYDRTLVKQMRRRNMKLSGINYHSIPPPFFFLFLLLFSLSLSLSLFYRVGDRRMKVESWIVESIKGDIPALPFSGGGLKSWRGTARR